MSNAGVAPQDQHFRVAPVHIWTGATPEFDMDTWYGWKSGTLNANNL